MLTIINFIFNLVITRYYYSKVESDWGTLVVNNDHLINSKSDITNRLRLSVILSFVIPLVTLGITQSMFLYNEVYEIFLNQKNTFHYVFFGWPFGHFILTTSMFLLTVVGFVYLQKILYHKYLE